MSALVTVKGMKQFVATIREKYGYPKDSTTGGISIMDSGWDITVVFYDKYFAQQEDDEDVFFLYGLWGEHSGDYIKKPMSECTGAEVLQEFLYHFNMLDWYPDLIEHTYVSLSMMPYITSQFMPRNSKGDRPFVRPQGSKNYAFIGQYVELEGDVVFTVETSVMCMKKMLETDEIKFSDLPPVNPLTMKKDIQGLLDFLNAVPSISWDSDKLY